MRRPEPTAGGLLAFARRFGPQVQILDREFLDPAREIVESPPSPIRMALAMAICAVFVVAFGAAVFGKIDIYAVASGRIEPAGRSKVIQPVDTGRVIGIYVQDGSHVVGGQLLLELDPTLSAADRTAAVAEQQSLAGEIARRKTSIVLAKAHLFDRSPVVFPYGIPANIRMREDAVLAADLGHLGTSVQLLQAKISEDVERIRALDMTMVSDRQLSTTLSQRVRMRQGLQRDGWESRANVLDAEEDLQKETSQMVAEEGQVLQTRVEIVTLRRQIDDSIAQFVSENTNALDAAEAKFDTNDQSLVKAAAKLSHMRLTSPISGTVQQLEVTTLGQVVTTGQQLMTVVPSVERLEIEALVQNRDIGFVRAGETAVVKIDSFPFTRYGTLSGRVVRVSRDAVTSPQQLPPSDTEEKPVSAQNSAAAPTPKTQDLVFPVRVLLDSDTMMVDGRRVRLSAGMSASVEIKTGKWRVISYLLSPFAKTISEAGHER